VAFFRACPAPGADTLIGNGNATTSPLVTIELVDCVARGEADFLRAPDLQPIRLVWDNGLLVTTERLLSAGGGQRSPQPGQSRRIDLRHLTAVVRGGLCLTSSNRLAPHQLTTEIHCADSILKVASAVPLIEQVGVEGKEYLRRQIVWNGDRNFYEDCDVFWMVRNVDPEVSPQSMSFDAWQAHWGPEQENLPSPGGVDWQKPADADRVVHSHLPEDYALAESTEADRNPAIGAAADGRNASFQADRLPPLPALPTAEGPAGADQPD